MNNYIKKIINRIVNKIVLKIASQLYESQYEVASASLPQFGNQPKNLRIDLPRRIINPERMLLGDDITLGPSSFLYAITQYPGPTMRHPSHQLKIQKFNPQIKIGHRVTATAGLQIASQCEVVIEDDVMFASNVFINDASHGYENAVIPFKYQPLFKIDPIHIGKGAWVGQNAVILSGVTIGELSIIGANSVVTGSIPEKCIAVGNPAKVIQRWDGTRWCPVPE